MLEEIKKESAGLEPENSNFVSEIKTDEKPGTEILDALFKETIFEVWKHK